MKVYKVQVRAEIHRLFVQEGLSAKEIARRFKGKPSAQTVSNWASEKRKDGSLTWNEERDDLERQAYENMSPEAQAQKILKRINFILNKDITKFNTKEADALAKLQKLMERVIDKKYQIPMMFELLTKFTEFLKDNYQELLSDEMLNAIKHFKNYKRKQLEYS